MKNGGIPLGMIQGHNIVLAALQPPKIPDQDRGDGAEEDAVGAHEVQETRRARQDLPRHHGPRDQRTQQLAPPDIHIAGKERAKIVGRAQAVGGDIHAQRGEHEGGTGEELAGSVRPAGDQVGRVPVQLAVVGLPRGGAGDADEGDEGEDDGEEGHVEPLPFHAGFAVAREVGHVD